MFWYISTAKVDHLASKGKDWREYLRGKLTFPLGVATAEAEVDPTPRKTDVERLRQLESKLRDARRVVSVRDLADASTAVFVEFRGRAARVVQPEIGWIAVLDGQDAVLLVGSPAHCVGVHPSDKESPVSPSADPLGAVTRLVGLSEGQTAGQNDPDLMDRLSYCWATVMRSATSLVARESMPVVCGIAVLAGFQKADHAQVRRSGMRVRVNRVVVGSPIFVEQISS